MLSTLLCKTLSTVMRSHLALYLLGYGRAGTTRFHLDL